jgi:heterotetrameric sarcosine oxidase gamma subunit
VHETSPIARSALIGPGATTRTIDGWELPDHRATGDVALADLSAVTKVLVKGPVLPEVDRAMGTRFGRATWDGDRLVTGAAPGEWLVLAPVGAAESIISHYRTTLASVTEQLTTVMDLSHGRALVRVSGPSTLRLLHRLTALDLDDRFVPDGAALRTSVARVVTDVVRDDVVGLPSYLLHCERSSGRYLLESLLAAGADLGAHVDGGDRPWPDHPSTS